MPGRNDSHGETSYEHRNDARLPGNQINRVVEETQGQGGGMTYKFAPLLELRSRPFYASVGIVPRPRRIRFMVRREGRFTWALLSLGRLRLYVDVAQRGAA